jgi:hypothetical protein
MASLMDSNEGLGQIAGAREPRLHRSKTLNGLRRTELPTVLEFPFRRTSKRVFEKFTSVLKER